MSKPSFVYVSYIRATPEEVWRALTDPAFTARYWAGTRVESDWAIGSPVRLVAPDGTADTGAVLVFDPPRRLSYTWHVGFGPFEAEPDSRVTFEIETEGGDVKLTLTHDEFQAGSKVLEAVSTGWPSILSSLKTLVETGEPLRSTDPKYLAEARERAIARAEGQ